MFTKGVSLHGNQMLDRVSKWEMFYANSYTKMVEQPPKVMRHKRKVKAMYHKSLASVMSNYCFHKTSGLLLNT